jgi:integrase
MAMIKKRVSKTNGKTSYLVAIRIKGHSPVYKTFPKKAIAERWASDTEILIIKGIFVDHSKADEYLLSDALERYKTEILPNFAATTIRSTEPKLDKLGEAFKNITLSKLTSDMLIEHVEKRKAKGLKGATIIKDLDWINATYNAAIHVWDIPCNNPVPSVRTKCRMTRKLKVDPGRDRRPTQDEITAIINYQKYTPINLISEFAMQTAMRRVEISSILRQHINYENRTLLIPVTKNGSPRRIPLTSRAAQILKLMTKDSTRIDSKIFGISEDAITYRFKKMREDLGIIDLKFHDLRHEGVSRFFEMGVFDTMEVAEISGHKTLNMLKRYTHLDAAELAKKLG